MSWSVIENLKTGAVNPSVPPNHVQVRVRRGKAKGTPWRAIEVVISPETSRKLCLVGEQSGVQMLLGGCDRVGKIGLTVNVQPGNFPARKLKNGGYAFMIRAASADGLFALDFPTFTAKAEEAPLQKGVPPVLMFAASAEMLAVED